MVRHKERTFTLLSGCEGGWVWQIVACIQRNGAFHHKGMLLFVDKRIDKTPEKNRIRKKDGRWFQRNLPKSFMEGKEIHHDWENGGICYILFKLEHRKKHY